MIKTFPFFLAESGIAECNSLEHGHQGPWTTTRTRGQWDCTESEYTFPFKQVGNTNYMVELGEKEQDAFGRVLRC